MGLAFSLSALAQRLPQTAVPPSITTLDTVETRLGTLRFTDWLPNEETTEKVYDQLDFMHGVDVFVNAFQGVSQYAIRKGFIDAGGNDNDVLIFSGLMDSKSLFLTANADTVYFWTYIDLSKGPMVVETTPGSLGVIDDMWWRWVTDFGLPGADRAEGARYLLVPPGYNGPLPDGGYFVHRSATLRAGILGRSFLENNDPAPAVAMIKKTLKVYPYKPGTYGTSIGDFLTGKSTLGALGDPPPTRFVEGTGKVMNTIPPNDFSFYEWLACRWQEGGEGGGHAGDEGELPDLCRHGDGQGTGSPEGRRVSPMGKFGAQRSELYQAARWVSRGRGVQAVRAARFAVRTAVQSGDTDA